MTNLSADRKTIGASIANLSGLTAEVAKLLTQGRPYIKADVAQLRRADGDPEQAEEPGGPQRGAQPAADDADRQTRTGTYGSWYQYYLCDFGAKIMLPKSQRPGDRRTAAQDRRTATATSRFYSKAKRCDP